MTFVRIRKALAAIASALLLTGVSLSQQSTAVPFPSGPPGADEVRFAAIGDSGTGGSSQYRVATRLLEIQKLSEFKILLFLGDNIYPSGSPGGFEKKFLKPYAPLFLEGVDFRGAIGNHDARSTYGTLLQQMVFDSGPKTFYSFTAGDGLIEFFALDTTQLSDPDDEAAASVQLQWLDAELSGSEAEWQIAFMHHPLYSSSKKHGEASSDMDELLRVRKLLEPLFVRYGLEVSLSGHDHVYERTKPIKGIQYFISGAAAKLRKNNLQRSTAYFEAGNDTERSFLLFSATPEVLRFWAIGEDGKPLDSGEIRKGCDKTPSAAIRLCPPAV